MPVPLLGARAMASYPCPVTAPWVSTVAPPHFSTQPRTFLSPSPAERVPRSRQRGRLASGPSTPPSCPLCRITVCPAGWFLQLLGVPLWIFGLVLCAGEAASHLAAIPPCAVAPRGLAHLSNHWAAVCSQAPGSILATVQSGAEPSTGRSGRWRPGSLCTWAPGTGCTCGQVTPGALCWNHSCEMGSAGSSGCVGG